jgi:hypothetical protein
MKIRLAILALLIIGYGAILISRGKRKKDLDLVMSIAGTWTEDDIRNMGWEDDGEGGVRRI